MVAFELTALLQFCFPTKSAADRSADWCQLEARSRQQQIEFSIVRRREANAQVCRVKLLLLCICRFGEDKNPELLNASMCQDCLRRQLDLQRGRTLSLEEEVARLKAATTCVSKKRMRQLEAQVQRLQCRPAAQGTVSMYMAAVPPA